MSWHAANQGAIFRIQLLDAVARAPCANGLLNKTQYEVPSELCVSPIVAWTVLDLVPHNWALVAISLTITCLIVIPALVLGRYIRISLNILRTTRPPLTRKPLDFEQLHGTPLSFVAHDGLALSGMLVRAAEHQPRRGLVLFAPEFLADMHSCARYCRPLVEAGYDVIAFDFRGHGESGNFPGYTPRQWVTNHEMSDIRGAISFCLRWLEERNLPAELGLLGVSRGGCAALLAAAEFPEVRAVATDGAFSTDAILEFLMKRWAYIFATVRVIYENHPPAFWRFMRWMLLCVARREFGCSFPSVRKSVARMKPRPILFIHGEKDSFLPVEVTSRMLYQLAGQPKYLWIAAGARHSQAVTLHPETYARLLTDFFDTHLSSIPAAREPMRTPAHAPTAVLAGPDKNAAG